MGRWNCGVVGSYWTCPWQKVQGRRGIKRGPPELGMIKIPSPCFILITSSIAFNLVGLGWLDGVKRYIIASCPGWGLQSPSPLGPIVTSRFRSHPLHHHSNAPDAYVLSQIINIDWQTSKVNTIWMGTQLDMGLDRQLRKKWKDSHPNLWHCLSPLRIRVIRVPFIAMLTVFNGIHIWYEWSLGHIYKNRKWSRD